MYLLRRFDQACEEADARGELQCAYSAGRGAEAISVGVCHALGGEDVVYPGLHGIGELLAMGSDPFAIMAELFGKVTGLNGGKGGRLHLIDRPHNVMGISGVLAASVPLATGNALAAKLRGNAVVTVCFVGDRATNQGVFHETLNFIGLWRLPILIVAVNNAPPDAVMALAGHTAAASLAALAGVHRIKATTMDAIDVLEVHQTAKAVVEGIREGSGPYFLEVKCYPLDELSQPETLNLLDEWQRVGPGVTFPAFRRRVLAERDRTPPATWRRGDPVLNLETRLLAEGDTDASALADARAGVDAVVEGALNFARESAEPPADIASAGVFAP